MYLVLWTRSALEEVTRLWLQASAAVRRAITAATHEIDSRLARDAANEGESRSGNRRILFAAPLAITFEVLEDQKAAVVLDVWVFGRRGGASN